MSDFFFLVPIALALGLAGLVAFLWTLRANQYDDLDGAAERILFEEWDRPIAESGAKDAAAAQLSSRTLKS